MGISIKKLTYNVYVKWLTRIALFILLMYVLKEVLYKNNYLIADESGRLVFSNIVLLENLKDFRSLVLGLGIIFFIYVLHKVDVELTQNVTKDLNLVIAEIKDYTDVSAPMIEEFQFILNTIRNERNARMKVEEENKNKEKLLKLQIAYLNHDIKTPLSIIKSNIDMLEKEKDFKQSKDKIMRIQMGTDKIISLVDELQDVIETWTCTELGVKEYSISEISNKIKNTVMIYADSFEKELEINIDKIDESRIKVDENMLSKAVINIVSNAFKYGSEHGKLTIKKIENALRIEMEDYGTGFKVDPQKAKELFFTENRARNIHGGYGIGLFFVETYLNSIRGDLEIINKDGGKGAIVSLHVPLDSDESK